MSAYLSLIGRRRGGRLLTFSAFRMGAYSRWALIRGWALIRINTVRLTWFDCNIIYLLEELIPAAFPLPPSTAVLL